MLQHGACETQVASGTHSVGVHLEDDNTERPHIGRARKDHRMVRDEQLGGLVRESPAVGTEKAFVETFVKVHGILGNHGYAKVSNCEMALGRDEDISWLQVAVDDRPIVKLVHA